MRPVGGDFIAHPSVFMFRSIPDGMLFERLLYTLKVCLKTAKSRKPGKAGRETPGRMAGHWADISAYDAARLLWTLSNSHRGHRENDGLLILTYPNFKGSVARVSYMLFVGLWRRKNSGITKAG